MSAVSSQDVQKHSVHTLVFRSLKRSHDLFLSNYEQPIPRDHLADKMLFNIKRHTEYAYVPETEREQLEKRQQSSNNTEKQDKTSLVPVLVPKPLGTKLQGINPPSREGGATSNAATALGLVKPGSDRTGSQSLVLRAPAMPKPQWHPPWKLYRVISGHTGWVRALAVEPGNQWFASGAGDRVIKIWDLASAQLKLSLTGHVSVVRGLVVSGRHPYLFSCGEDKQVKCWDLEVNKVVRHYHGHLSAVHTIDLHPTIDLLVTGGRDSTARVWDMRTKAQIHALTGHSNTVASVKCQSVEPQVLTASHDSTIRLWDIVAGRTRVTLTNHKKSVRGLTIHPTLNMMASASADNIKEWKLPNGEFLQNLSGHSCIVNTLACNADDVLVSAGDNGSMFFWDWKSGYNFQRLQSQPQPGSIDSEAGIFAMTFDHSGSRLITGEADKTIKIYREDETASEETHPLNWKPGINKKARY